MSNYSGQTAEHVKDYLRGYASRGADALKQLAAFGGWQRLAQRELERRAYRLIEAFDDDMLRAIAKNEIDLPTLCREVGAETQ